MSDGHPPDREGDAVINCSLFRAAEHSSLFGQRELSGDYHLCQAGIESIPPFKFTESFKGVKVMAVCWL